MILFPNAKINIGLRITERRPDGYHNISTLMVPVGWCDILEIIPGDSPGLHLHTFEPLEGCEADNNLVMKALRAVEHFTEKTLPPLDIYLKKTIPTGAGLGGGSADASFAIRGVNELCALGLDDNEMAQIALSVGADCPFFIYNRPALARGIGERLTPVDLGILDGYGIAIVKPQAEAVSTARAYAGITPQALPQDQSPVIASAVPPYLWSKYEVLTNDFEASIFPLCPQIAQVKRRMYDAGAIYASMSGSGAAVYGIFENVKMAEAAIAQFEDCDSWFGTAMQ